MILAGLLFFELERCLPAKLVQGFWRHLGHVGVVFDACEGFKR